MTREEQINQELKTRYETPHYNAGFVEGAHWADEHPHWISVDDELPPLLYKNLNESVLALTYGMYVRTAFYVFDEDEWVGNYKVTHWMPLPKMPILSKLENIGKDLKGGEEI